MAFDINETLKGMAAAIKGEVGDNWNDVKETAEEFLERRKERLKMIADFRLAGDLDDADVKSRLEDEKLMAEAELNTLAVITKVIAQRAANAAIDVLTKSIKAAVDAAL